ncbi:hypothetical protein [Actinomadura harenae]|uniref:hypothetical protein n=1 Tax=Actinomadura harenae TaxID=2483351 RepID=UPI0013152ACA|nr:hypothetical protein [Actinomadura harenae]
MTDYERKLRAVLAAHAATVRPRPALDLIHHLMKQKRRLGWTPGRRAGQQLGSHRP